MTTPQTIRRMLAALLLAATAGTACATNPVTGERELSLMSEQQEIAIGRQNDEQIRQEMGVYDDQDLQRYVSQLGQRLAKVSHRPDLPWQFTVVDTPAINAFALPGGFIYITRGILPYLDNEAELAGVLGHEIGHVTARHAAQQYTRATGGTLGLAALSIFVPEARPFGDLASTGLGLLFLKYGRDDELQADRLGIEYAAEAGYDPTGVPHFLQTLARIDSMSERGVPNFLSTHPDPGSRVDDATPIAAKYKSANATATNQQAFQREIDGIIVGDNPKEGVVRGNQFLHPVLRLKLRFPDGWEVQNSPAQVVAKAPEANHFMLLKVVQQPQGHSLEQVAVNSMNGANFRRVDGGATRINGLDAYVGVYQGALEGLGNVVLRAAHIAVGDTIYMFGGFAPEGEFRSVDGTISQSIQTFERMSASEAEAIHPNRLDYYTARSGDTWEAIARRAGEGIIQPSRLAIMNGYAASQQPRAGDRLKIVVAG
ncbi:MAG: M48 family metalloprotease [Vicinamibacterales bacterium]